MQRAMHLFHDIVESRYLKVLLFDSFNMYVLTISLKHRKYIFILYTFSVRCLLVHVCRLFTFIYRIC